MALLPGRHGPEPTRDDLACFCCLNPDCTDLGRRGVGNLRVISRCGGRKQYRIWRCRTCGGRFSERLGTSLFRAHLPEEKAVSLLEHLDEGWGICQTGRFVQVCRDTGMVIRYGREAGAHVHDVLVTFSSEDPRGLVRSERVVRGQEAGALQPRGPGR